jgi:hypothetical protein
MFATKATPLIAAVLLLLLLLGCSGTPKEDAGPRTETTRVETIASELPWSDLVAEARAHGLTDDVPGPVRRVCSAVAERAVDQGQPQPVFCPPLVPDTAIKVELAGGVLRYRHFDDGYNIGFWSPDVDHANDAGGHWSIAAGDAASLRVLTHPPAPAAPPGADRAEPLIAPTSTTTLRGVPVTVYRMPTEAQGGAGFYSGHVVFEWAYRGTTFHVTMHGHQNEPQTRAMAAALIEELRLCATEEDRKSHPDACRLVFGRGSLR